MEGPSLIIACEELKPFVKGKIAAASGVAKLPFEELDGATLKRVQSWGKHLLLTFSTVTLRIHFLMFGSYRIDNPRENRLAKLEVEIDSHKIYFYSCAVKVLEKKFENDYDWTVDLMSPKWNPVQALKSVKTKPAAQICDILMNQNIFSGLGNIMKNEILFNLRMHPETKVMDLKLSRLKALVSEAERYAWQFYEWKKKNVLKRNWLVMRKRTCPKCNGKIIKCETGKLKRLSHYCSKCQLKK